jgi:hypothetical protein
MLASMPSDLCQRSINALGCASPREPTRSWHRGAGLPERSTSSGDAWLLLACGATRWLNAPVALGHLDPGGF